MPAVSPNGSGPANPATIRAAVTAALKDDGYLHIPEGRRDHTTPAETLRPHGLDQSGQKRTFTEHAGALTSSRQMRTFTPRMAMYKYTEQVIIQ